MRRGIAVVVAIVLACIALAILIHLASGDEYTATAEVSVDVEPAPAPGTPPRRRRPPPVLVPGSEPDAGGDGIEIGPNARDARPGAPDAGGASQQQDQQQPQPAPEPQQPDPPPLTRPQLNSIAAAADEPAVTRDVIAQLHLSTSPSALGEDISAEVGKGRVVRVEATRESRNLAERTANSVAANLAGGVPELPAARRLRPAQVKASVTKTATGAEAADKGGPNIGKAIAIGLPLGIVLALLLHLASLLEARRAQAKAEQPDAA